MTAKCRKRERFVRASCKINWPASSRYEYRGIRRRLCQYPKNEVNCFETVEETDGLGGQGRSISGALRGQEKIRHMPGAPASSELTKYQKSLYHHFASLSSFSNIASATLLLHEPVHLLSKHTSNPIHISYPVVQSIKQSSLAQRLSLQKERSP